MLSVSKGENNMITDKINNSLTAFLGVLAIGGMMQIAFPGHIKAGGGGTSGSSVNSEVESEIYRDESGRVEEVYVEAERVKNNPEITQPGYLHQYRTEIHQWSSGLISGRCYDCNTYEFDGVTLRQNVEVMAEEIKNHKDEEEPEKANDRVQMEIDTQNGPATIRFNIIYENDRLIFIDSHVN